MKIRQLTLVSLICITGLLAVAAQLVTAQERPRYGGIVYLESTSRATRSQYPTIVTLSGRETYLPGVLQQWRLSPDGLNLTLLFADSRHAGAQTTGPDDLIRAIEQEMQKIPETALAGVFHSIAGSESFLSGEYDYLSGIQRFQDTLIEIRLKRRQPMMLTALAELQVSGNKGPFTMADRLSLLANKSCSEGRPFLDRVGYAQAGMHEAASNERIVEITDDLFSRKKNARPEMKWLQYPGWQSVYMVCKQQGKLATAEQRNYFHRLIALDELINIFFNDAEAQEYLLPDEALAMVPALQAELVAAEPLQMPAQLSLAYAAGDELLRLTAERIVVDLLQAGVDIVLQPYKNSAPVNADIYLFSELISAYSPEYSLWKAMTEFANAIEDESMRRYPGDDLYLWMVGIEQWNRGEKIIRPMFNYRWGVSLDQQLHGLQFRPDGTLDFSDAWISNPEEDQ